MRNPPSGGGMALSCIVGHIRGDLRHGEVKAPHARCMVLLAGQQRELTRARRVCRLRPAKSLRIFVPGRWRKQLLRAEAVEPVQHAVDAARPEQIVEQAHGGCRRRIRTQRIGERTVRTSGPQALEPLLAPARRTSAPRGTRRQAVRARRKRQGRRVAGWRRQLRRTSDVSRAGKAHLARRSWPAATRSLCSEDVDTAPSSRAASVSFMAPFEAGMEFSRERRLASWRRSNLIELVRIFPMRSRACRRHASDA